jgi:hypothetical protein
VEGIKRVVTIGKMNVTLQRCICVVLGKYHEWMVMFQRTSDNTHQNLTLLNIQLTSGKTLMLPWLSWKLAAEPEFFFFDDWFMIETLLKSVNVETHGMCGVTPCALKERPNWRFKIFLSRPLNVADDFEIIDLDDSDHETYIVEQCPEDVFSEINSDPVVVAGATDEEVERHRVQKRARYSR